MGFLHRHDDETAAAHTAAAAVEGEAHRIEASISGARARIRAYLDDLHIEERPTDADLRAVLDELDRLEGNV